MQYFKLGMDKKLIVPYGEYMKAMKPDFSYIGDKSEITDLVRCLFLPSASSVKVVGARGSGTTVLLDALAHHQTSDFMPDDFMFRPLFRFNANNLFSTSDTKTIETRFQSALDEMQKYYRQRKVKPVLVIDDGYSFTDNAPQHVINMLIEAAVTADYVDLIIGVDKKKEEEFNAKHPEFSNSFTTKEIKEPGAEELINILEHHAKKHAKNGVICSSDVLEHVADITNRFKAMYDTAQPNRAIRLLDSAATAFRIKVHSLAPGNFERQQELKIVEGQIASGKLEGDELASRESAVDTLKIEIKDAHEAWEAHRKKIKTLKDDIAQFDILITSAEQDIEKLDEETKQSNYEDLYEMFKDTKDGDAIFKGRNKGDVLNLDREKFLDFAEFDLNVHRNPRIKELTADITRYASSIDVKQTELTSMSDKMHQPTVMPASVVDEIATAVTKTPVGGVSGRLKENLVKGVSLMQETVYGQDHVLEPIVSSLKRAAAGLNDPNRPLGVFMIAGPPGVGKTHIAKQLAIKLFGSEDYFALLDMENFKGDHTVSTLIGAPPGYSGYGKKGKLVEIGQEKPFCVLLLDEIEKAHFEVRQALLKVKGSGRMVGLDGEEADFRNIIIVETTNYGKDLWVKHDFETASRLIEERMRLDTEVFSPEYLDRNDAILFAGPLDQMALTKIVNKTVKGIEQVVTKRHPDFSISVPWADQETFVRDHCIGHSGRRAEMLINKVVGDPLTEILLSSTAAAGTFNARYDKEKQAFVTSFEREVAPKPANGNKAMFDAASKLVVGMPA